MFENVLLYEETPYLELDKGAIESLRIACRDMSLIRIEELNRNLQYFLRINRILVSCTDDDFRFNNPNYNLNNVPLDSFTKPFFRRYSDMEILNEYLLIEIED